MNNTAVVILGHGSRRSEGQVTVTQTADRYRQNHPEYRTAYAFMEFVEPTLPQITAELYEDGIRVFMWCRSSFPWGPTVPSICRR